MTEPIIFEGKTLTLVRFGPLEVVSLKPVTAEALEKASDDSDIWGHLGLRIDPRQYHHDAPAIARAIMLYMTFEESRTGVSWSVDPYSLASRIYLNTEPTIIPLWKEE